MIQDHEYEGCARQFEEACKRLAPKLHLRVWRWEEATRRLSGSGLQGHVTCPNYLFIELQIKVDDERFLKVTHANTMQWLFMPEHRDEMVVAHIRFLLNEITHELVG